MTGRLLYVTIIVRDYEESLQWYTRCFAWEKRMDRGQGVQRWLSLGIPGQQYPEIILQIPDRFEGKDRERKQKQIGENPTWILETDDCVATMERMRREGVKVVREPQAAPLGIAALVEDLYGNVYTFLQLSEAAKKA